MLLKAFYTSLLVSVQFILFAQISSDSLHLKYLPEITVVGSNNRSDIQQIPEIVGTTIYAGKKNALVVLDNVNGNVVSNTMRQVMAKVPGIHIWESDGSGIQIGIAARGLSPNRSWEFNVRQNGYDIAADPFGYPEAYYNPQLQSVQRIEVVRGQGALQYGPQFGGMVNYILKNGSTFDKPIQLETEQTIGSNGLFNSYNAVGGKYKKIHYYTFFDHRNADGWRKNSQYHTNSGFGTITYKPTEKFSLTFELMKWNMLSQQPGGLTDTEIQQNSQQSLRSRNWFNLDWTTAALIGNYYFSENSRLNVKVFGIRGIRNSVGFMPSNGIIVPDSINAKTLHYNTRNVDIDQYNNYGLEARFITDYRFLHQKNTLSSGIRLYKGNTHRYKTGKGTSGTDYDITLADPLWAGDINYQTVNGAFFIENIFRWSDKIYIIPGIRYEYISGKASGYNGLSNNLPVQLEEQQRSRNFILAGIGTEYYVSPSTEIYGNISQAYRPIQFADLTTPTTTDKIDPNLTDSKGFNADLGYRGKLEDFLFFDISLYYLQYNNRVGTIKQQNQAGTFYNLRTNVGNSNAKGVESLLEFSPTRLWTPRSKFGHFNIFSSYSYNDARYENFKVITLVNGALNEKNYNNNKIENAPEHIFRSGVNYLFKGFQWTTQMSHVSKCFADANNTILPSANAQNGLIPAYTVWDMTLSYHYQNKHSIKIGVNNLGNVAYFTRRAGGYPGPGALPSDGRTFFATIKIRL